METSHARSSTNVTPVLDEDSSRANWRLFLPPDMTERAGYQRVERQGTRLVTISARHSALTQDEARAISAFRLRQYVLAGLYDREIVQRLELTADPAMALLAADDVHIAVGDTSGQFLCYLSMQSPLGAPTTHRGAATDSRRASGQTLGDESRPYFPCETEYGLDIFGHHPSLRDLPLARVRELTRLVRAQGARDRRAALAVIEVVIGMVHALLDPQTQIAAIIGCSVAEARRLLHGLGMPLAYAPLAPILGDNQSGVLPGHELIWSGAANAPGRFWPFGLVTCDLADEREYIAALDAALDLPEADALREVGRIRRRGPQKPSRLIVPPEASGGVFWTGEPFYADPR